MKINYCKTNEFLFIKRKVFMNRLLCDINNAIIGEMEKNLCATFFG